MNAGSVRLSHEGPVALVRFDNPPRGYLDAAQTRELAGVVEALAKDAATRAVVFAGAVPGVFIRHYDVSEILAVAERVRGLPDEALAAAGRAGNEVTAVFDAIDTLTKPTIAAINGMCMGGGFELALCCDLRVTEPGEHRIGLPETRIGIFPGAGGTERLARAVGEARALELILRGRTAGPEEALALGVVHELAPEGAVARALAIATELSKLPARALAEAKALVKNRGGLAWADRHARSRERFLAVLDDTEAERLMRAFLAEGEDIERPPA